MGAGREGGPVDVNHLPESQVPPTPPGALAGPSVGAQRGGALVVA